MRSNPKQRRHRVRAHDEPAIQCATACSPPTSSPQCAVDAHLFEQQTEWGRVMACLVVAGEARASGTQTGADACRVMLAACGQQMLSAMLPSLSDEVLSVWACSCLVTMHIALQASNRQRHTRLSGSAALCLVAGAFSVVALVGRAAAYIVEQDAGPASLVVTPVRIHADLLVLGEAEDIDAGLTLQRKLSVSPHLSLVTACGYPLPQAAHIKAAWHAGASLHERAATIGHGPPRAACPPHIACGFIAARLKEAERKTT